MGPSTRSLCDAGRQADMTHTPTNKFIIGQMCAQKQNQNLKPGINFILDNCELCHRTLLEGGVGGGGWRGVMWERAKEEQKGGGGS